MARSASRVPEMDRTMRESPDSVVSSSGGGIREAVTVVVVVVGDGELEGGSTIK